jgi:hypothetical protein
MRKFGTTTAAVILLTCLVGATTTSDAAGTVAAQARHQHVMRFVLHVVESHQVGPHRNVGVDRLRSLGTHQIAGYDDFSSVFQPKSDHLRFWDAISLKDGLIDTYFNLQRIGSDRFSGRITHGYGKFRGIQGRLHVHDFPSGRTVYTLRYSL